MAASPETMTLVRRLVTGGAGAAAIASALLFGTGGLEGRKLTSYPDPATGAAPFTVCGGVTQGIRPGMTFTDSECDDMDAEALEDARSVVARCAPSDLPPATEAAMISFAFNVGPGAKNRKDGFCTLADGRTPTFLRKLRAGDIPGACNALTDWSYANGKQMRGLLARREQEKEICLLGVTR